MDIAKLELYIVTHKNKKFRDLFLYIVSGIYPNIYEYDYGSDEYYEHTPAVSKYIADVGKLITIALNNSNIFAVKIMQKWYNHAIIITDYAFGKLRISFDNNIEFMIQLFKQVEFLGETILKNSVKNDELFNNTILLLRHKNTYLGVKTRIHHIFASLTIDTIDKFIIIYELLYADDHDNFRDIFIRNFNFPSHVYVKYKFTQQFPEKIWEDMNGNNLFHYAAYNNTICFFNSLFNKNS